MIPGALWLANPIPEYFYIAYRVRMVLKFTKRRRSLMADGKSFYLTTASTKREDAQTGEILMILHRLKQETRRYHEQLERSLNLVDEHLTLARYKYILVHFLGFYQPVERLFSTFQQGHILNREVERRRKVPWLLQDLKALGIADADLATLPTCTDLPTFDTLYQALGCMYVLEGATLGGQIITRHIQRVLRLDECCGCAFFHGYGSDTGPMWKAFGELLVTHISNGEAEHAVIFAACETFTLFHQWIVEGVRI